MFVAARSQLFSITHCMAARLSSAAFERPSLRLMFSRCVSSVCVVMKSRSAMTLETRPEPINWKISNSRLVSRWMGVLIRSESPND